MNSVFVEIALRPSFGIGWTRMCAGSIAGKNRVMPSVVFAPAERAAVRVISSSRSACSAREMKIFWPLTR